METSQAANGLKVILGVIPPPPLPSTIAQTSPLLPPGMVYLNPLPSRTVAASINIMPLLLPPNIATLPMQGTTILLMHN